MKKIFTFLIALITLCITTNAQDDLEFIPSTNSTVFEEDPYEAYDLKLYSTLDGKIFNRTDADIGIVWELRIISLPEFWSYEICDDNACWLDLTSNVGTPMVVTPNSYGLILLAVIPNTVSGCAVFEIDAYNANDMTKIISTGVFTYTVFDDCSFSTSTIDFEDLNALSIYPNPTQDKFFISDNDLVENIEIINSIGKSVGTYKGVSDNESIDISNLPQGIYYIGMEDENGQLLKSTPLIKK